MIAESTRRLVGNLFELEDLEAQALKGILGPLRAWAALRPSSVESRSDALHASGLTELVGREEELELLLRHWLKAKNGAGQVVLLSGEPGIGKSRLTAALLERLATEPHTPLRYFCSPQHTGSGPAKEIAQIGAAIGREFSHALWAAVVRKPEPELASALERLVAAGLLFRQGVAPYATYVFKHALVQDAAYSTLPRKPRRALHARIAEALESQFAETAESQPEILARHCTEAGLIEKAASLWGNAGQQSLARSALVEAEAHLARALEQIATLPSTAALRREQIKLQVALITPRIHIRGHAAAETKAAEEQARLLIERAEARGKPPEDPPLLFSVLYGFWVANYVAFDGDVICNLAEQFLALAQKHGGDSPALDGASPGASSLFTGDIAKGRAQLDQAIALYHPAEHHSVATRFGQEARRVSGASRSLACHLETSPRKEGIR